MKLEELKNQPYKMQYAKACNEIMETLVPPSGQAECLQGELLRECEKLRYEAQTNGNYNWDEWFLFFCDHICESLCAQPYFDAEKKQEVQDITLYLKSCGEYARAILDDDSLPDDYPVDVERLAYVGDNLYDILADCIGRMHTEAGKLLPYTKNPQMYR